MGQDVVEHLAVERDVRTRRRGRCRPRGPRRRRRRSPAPVGCRAGRSARRARAGSRRRAAGPGWSRSVVGLSSRSRSSWAAITPGSPTGRCSTASSSTATTSSGGGTSRRSASWRRWRIATSRPISSAVWCDSSERISAAAVVLGLQQAVHDGEVERADGAGVALQRRVAAGAVEDVALGLHALGVGLPPAVLAPVVDEPQEQVPFGVGDDPVDPHQLADVGHLGHALARLQPGDLGGGAGHALGDVVEREPRLGPQSAQLGPEPAAGADRALGRRCCGWVIRHAVRPFAIAQGTGIGQSKHCPRCGGSHHTGAVIPRGGRDAPIHHDSPSPPDPRPVRALRHRDDRRRCPPTGKELDDDVPHHQQPSAAHRQVVTVIMMIVGGLGFLLLAAIVVGIVDALQASSWRRIAAERREQWESRHLQPHGRVRLATNEQPPPRSGVRDAAARPTLCYRARRPDRARPRVSSSANSRSPPIGRPDASRVTVSPGKSRSSRTR